MLQISSLDRGPDSDQTRPKLTDPNTLTGLVQTCCLCTNWLYPGFMKKQTLPTYTARIARLGPDGKHLGWIEARAGQDVLDNFIASLFEHQVPFDFRPLAAIDSPTIDGTSSQRRVKDLRPQEHSTGDPAKLDGDEHFMALLDHVGAHTNAAIATVIVATLLQANTSMEVVSPEEVLAYWPKTGKAKPAAIYRDMRLATAAFSKNRKSPNDWLLEHPGKRFSLKSSIEDVLRTPGYFLRKGKSAS